jgi:glyoxylase-like metal-dependent hydrolase (beta-lactamase superfamily II)
MVAGAKVSYFYQFAYYGIFGTRIQTVSDRHFVSCGKIIRMQIIPLNEGIFTVTKTKEFTSIQRSEVETAGPGLLKMAICPFLIILPDDIILLDTGLDLAKKGKPETIRLIEEAGYTAEQVTKVLLSHLHKDHIEGLGRFTDEGFAPNFSNAQIYFQKKELEYALQQTESYSFNPEYVKILQELPNVVLMNDDHGTIGKYITYEVTGGHSPFHQVFWINEGGTTAFFGADNLPQKSYLKFHIAYKSDDDGKKAMELRQIWEKQAKEENWKVLFYHDFSKNCIELS